MLNAYIREMIREKDGCTMFCKRISLTSSDLPGLKISWPPNRCEGGVFSLPEFALSVASAVAVHGSSEI